MAETVWEICKKKDPFLDKFYVKIENSRTSVSHMRKLERTRPGFSPQSRRVGTMSQSVRLGKGQCSEAKKLKTLK